jgi:hypothetical protein
MVILNAGSIDDEARGDVKPILEFFGENRHAWVGDISSKSRL